MPGHSYANLQWDCTSHFVPTVLRQLSAGIDFLFDSCRITVASTKVLFI